MPDGATFKPGQLEADGPFLADFIDALFRYADEGTWVSLRAFRDNGAEGEAPIHIQGVALDGGVGRVVQEARRVATRCANMDEPVVFCPPVATFNNPHKATEEALANGVALSVECDARPEQARRQLEALLGPATMVVASGGTWTDQETGEVQDKVHLHWRLSEPTRQKADHDQLKRARGYATALVGADASNVPITHPIRWPGSWHRKGAPKLARIVDQTDREIDLTEALERLEEALAAAGFEKAPKDGDKAPGEAGTGEPRETGELVRQIITGAEFHRPLVTLAMRYLKGGMSDAQAVITLRGFLEAVPDAARDHKDGEYQAFRWLSRYAEIPRYVREARAKIAAAEKRDQQAKAEAEAEADAGQQKPGEHFGRLRVLSVEDAMNAPTRTYLLDGLIAPGELSVWWGAPKCGKSFLMLRLAYGLAQGKGMWGRDAEPCPTLYVAAEGEGGVMGRIRVLREVMGPAPDFRFIAQPVDLFDPEADLDLLIAAAKAVGAKMVVVDTLARVMVGGDESATKDMNAFVRNLDRIREATKAHVAVVHHGGKDDSRGPRGSVALTGAADLVVQVEGRQGEARQATVTHAKDDEAGYSLGFALRSAELPPDAKGRPRSTCIAVEADVTHRMGDAHDQRRHARPLTDTQRGWFRDIEALFAEPGLARSRVPLEGMAPQVTLTRDQVRDGLRRRGRFGDATGDAKLTGADRTALYKMLNLLKDKGKVGLSADFVWLL